MTAYLQPGDKIHLAIPSDWGSRKVTEEMVQIHKDNYAIYGIEVIFVTTVMHTQRCEVVSVIRPMPIPGCLDQENHPPGEGEARLPTIHSDPKASHRPS